MKNNIFTVKNIFLVIILSVFGIFLNVGLTYFFSVNSYFTNYVNDNYTLRLYYLNIENDIDKENLIEKLKENVHVIDVFKYEEYSVYGNISEFKTDNLDGEILLYAIENVEFDIVSGNNISNDMEIICPSNLYSNSLINENNFNYNRSLNTNNFINDTLSFSLYDQLSTELKLVGTYNRSSNYTEANACYTTHETIKKLNEKLSNYSEEDALISLLDDSDNVNFLDNYEEIIDYSEITKLRIDVLLNIIKIVGIITCIFILFIYIICSLFTNRNILSEYRNIGILRIVGYSNLDIKKKYYKEMFFILLISFIINNAISYIIFNNFVSWFLYKNEQLCLINLGFNITSIVISFVVLFISIFISLYNSLKKIDKIDIGEIVNE